MSNVIDERIVQMEFDNSRFQKNAQDTIKALDNLDDQINITAENSSDALIDLSDGLDRMELVMKGFYERIGEYIADLGIKFAEMGKNFVESMTTDQIKEGFNKYTAETLAAQTVVSTAADKIAEAYGIIGSPEEIEQGVMQKTYDALENIAKYADETSYSVGNLQDTMSKMVMGGTDLEDAVTAVKGIGNWAAVTGAGIDKANAVMPALVKSFNAGYVRLRDWQSVQANSMADPTFVEKLLGYARQYSDEMREWEEINGKLDYKNYMEYAFGNNKWISAEALVATLAEYGDETTLIGEKGKAAAAEAKTLTEALNAGKDAVSSGWSLSFRYIFGDYKEARKFFTVVQDSLLEVFTIGKDFRNQVLAEWHNLGGFEDIVEAMKEMWSGIKALVTPIGDAFHEIFGLEDVDKAAKVLKNFTGKIKDAARQLSDFYTTPNELFEITDRIKNGELDKLPDELKEKYTNLLGNPDNWGLKTAEQLDNLLFGSWYKNGDIQQARYILSDIKDLFEGLFSVIKTGKDIISGFLSSCKSIASVLSNLTRPILEVSGSIGRYLTRVKEALEETKLINRFWDSLTKIAKSALEPAIELVTRALKWLSTEIDKADTHFLKQSFEKLAITIEKVSDVISGALSASFEWLGKAFDKVRDKLEPLKKSFSDVFSTISDFVNKKFGANQESKVSTFLGTIGNALSNFGDFLLNSAILPALDTLVNLFLKLFEAAKPLGSALATAFSNIGAAVGSISNKKDTEESGGALSTLFETLGKIVNFITEKAVVPLLQGLADVIQKLCDSTSPLGQVFSDAWKGIKEFFTNIFNAFSSGETDAENANKLSTFLANVGTVVGTVFGWFADFFNTIHDNIKGSIERLKSLSFEEIVDRIKSIISIFTGIAVGTTVMSIGEFFGSAADLINGINVFHNALKSTKGAADIIIDVGKSLLMFAAALFIISGIDKEKLIGAADTISTFIDSLVASIIAINMTSIYWNINIGAFNGLKANGANLFASNILDLALAVLLIAFALKKLAEADLSQEKIQPALDTITSIIETLTVVELMMSLATSKFETIGGFKFAGGSGGVKGILVFAVSIYLISKALTDLANKADPKNLAAATDAMVSVITALGMVVILLNLVKSSKGLSSGLGVTVKMETTLLQLAVVIGALAALMYVISNYVTGDDSLITATVCLSGLVLALILLGKAAESFNAKASNLLEMYALVGILAALAGVLAILDTLDPGTVALGLLELVGAFAILLAVAGVAESLSKNIGDLAAGIVALYALSGILAAMAGVLVILSQIDPGTVALGLLELIGALAILFAAAWIATLDPVAKGLRNLGDAFLEFGIAILAGGVGIYAVAKGFQLIVDTLVNGVPLIKDSAGEIFLSITALLAAAIAAVSAFVPAIIGMVVGILVGIIASLAASAMEIVNSVVDLLNKVADAIDANSDLIGEALARLLVALLKTLWSFLKNLALDLLEWFGVRKEEVSSWFKNIWQSIKDWFANAVQSIRNWFADIRKSWDDMWAAIGEWLDGIDQAISDFFTNIWKSITGWFDKIRETVSKAWNSILDFFNPSRKENQQAVSDATTVGANVAAGAARGINNNANLVSEASTNMTRLAVKAAQAGFDEHSPSRVFMEIGKYVDEGLAKGIDDNAYLAIDSTENLANSSVTAMQDALSEIAALDLSNTSDPVIRPVLDLSEIQNGARNIGSFFNGNYSLGLAANAIGVSGDSSTPLGNVFNFTINGDGQSAQDIANEVMNRINMELRSRSNIWRR